MQTGTTQGGTLYALVNNRELTRFGVSFSTLQKRDVRTASVIRQVLRRLHRKHPFISGVITVEALPTANGCLFLVTPSPRPIERDGIHIFAPRSDALLPQIAAMCQQGMNGIVAASLYAYGDAYRLLLYAPHISADEITRLTEFAPFVGGGKLAAAHIAERGTPLYIGNALESV